MISKYKKLLRAKLREIEPLERWMLNHRFSEEIRLINGDASVASDKNSIIHLSFNKAATQHIKTILSMCAIEAGMMPVRLDDYAFHSDFPYLDQLSEVEIQKYVHVFQPKGYLYSLFGGALEGIPNFSDYKAFLVTRDPRDILVSQYFSTKKTHSVPSPLGNKRKAFLELREQANHMTIDEFALFESERVLDVYRRYQLKLLEVHRNLYITKYEAMLADFSGWLSGLLEYCELNPSDKLMARIISFHDSKRPLREDQNKHIRRGVAGDYKDKLRPETIEQLNFRYEGILSDFGYKI